MNGVRLGILVCLLNCMLLASPLKYEDEEPNAEAWADDVVLTFKDLFQILRLPSEIQQKNQQLLRSEEDPGDEKKIHFKSKIRMLMESIALRRKSEEALENIQSDLLVNPLNLQPIFKKPKVTPKPTKKLTTKQKPKTTPKSSHKSTTKRPYVPPSKSTTPRPSSTTRRPLTKSTPKHVRPTSTTRRPSSKSTTRVSTTTPKWPAWIQRTTTPSSPQMFNHTRTNLIYWTWNPWIDKPVTSEPWWKRFTWSPPTVRPFYHKTGLANIMHDFVIALLAIVSLIIVGMVIWLAVLLCHMKRMRRQSQQDVAQAMASSARLNLDVASGGGDSHVDDKPPEYDALATSPEMKVRFCGQKTETEPCAPPQYDTVVQLPLSKSFSAP